MTFAVQELSQVTGTIDPVVGASSGALAVLVVSLVDVARVPSEATLSMPLVLVEIPLVARTVIPLVNAHPVLAARAVNHALVATVCEIHRRFLRGLTGGKEQDRCGD